MTMPDAGFPDLTDPTAVRFEVTVPVPQATAFEVFTRDFDAIKPREHNMLPVEIDETVLEPRAGGAVFDRGIDGSVCEWARVLAFEPPARLVLAWKISPYWQLESDPERASEVEVLFIQEAPDLTRVRLVHSHLDRHGEGWEGFRQGLASGDAWPLYLRRYVDLVPAR
jgi:uncharacterized protein YndB with AHSA1/START domain